MSQISILENIYRSTSSCVETQIRNVVLPAIVSYLNSKGYPVTIDNLLNDCLGMPQATMLPSANVPTMGTAFNNPVSVRDTSLDPAPGDSQEVIMRKLAARDGPPFVPTISFDDGFVDGHCHQICPRGDNKGTFCAKPVEPGEVICSACLKKYVAAKNTSIKYHNDPNSYKINDIRRKNEANIMKDLGNPNSAYYKNLIKKGINPQVIAARADGNDRISQFGSHQAPQFVQAPPQFGGLQPPQFGQANPLIANAPPKTTNMTGRTYEGPDNTTPGLVFVASHNLVVKPGPVDIHVMGHADSHTSSMRRLTIDECKNAESLGLKIEPLAMPVFVASHKLAVKPEQIGNSIIGNDASNGLMGGLTGTAQAPQFGQTQAHQFGQTQPQAPQFGQSQPQAPQFGQSQTQAPQFVQTQPQATQFGQDQVPQTGNTFTPTKLPSFDTTKDSTVVSLPAAEPSTLSSLPSSGNTESLPNQLPATKVSPAESSLPGLPGLPAESSLPSLPGLPAESSLPATKVSPTESSLPSLPGLTGLPSSGNSNPLQSMATFTPN